MIDAIPDALFSWAGHVGVAFYVGSYGLLQAGIIRGSSLLYTVMNLIAASLVLVSLSVAFNLSSALIQVLWIVISIVGLVRIALQNSWVRFDDTERALIEDVLADMPKPLARKFLNAGTWHDAPPGTVLASETKPVTALHYISHGQAQVTAAGLRVADLRAGFIGEMNVLEDGPASASVTVTQTARVFTISGAMLRRLRARDADLRICLDRALTRDTAAKLMRANAQIAAQNAAE